MATTAPTTADRGQWGSKLGFVLAAAGSAVGLGNIWRFPGEVADNGGAAFIFVYLISCFAIGFPVMVAELTIGRRTERNPVGAFKALSQNRFFPLVGGWGVLCGAMILSFYLVVAGWTLSFALSELFYFLGNDALTTYFGDIGNGPKNAAFSLIFIAATIFIVAGGVSSGIERAAKVMMPILVVILLVMIGYVFTQEGASEGLAVYLKPDFSKINMQLILAAMGQAFFSLSLGMGALITYGSYLNKRQNIPEAALYVTLSDVGIAIIAGLLIIPSMYVAQAGGITIFDETGNLVASTTLVFDVLPALFHTMSPFTGALFGVSFFLLLSLAALTSTISLLEVPVSYAVDERGLKRRKAAILLGGGIGLLAVIVSFRLALIDQIDLVFSTIGLPLGGLLICLFLAYVWTTQSALTELREGYEHLDQSFFRRAWPFFIRYVCPILIAAVFVSTIVGLLR